MTVSATLNKVRTTGNGVTVAFPASIKIFAETDITVKTIVIATDVKANDLILNDAGALGFTVVFDTDAETLTVTVNTAPTSLEDIQILRVLPITQTTDFPVATKFPAISSENAHDKNTMILQDQQEQLDRAFALPEESSATNPSLPTPSSRRALIWDPAEDGTIINSAKDPDAAQTDAAASATAASASEGNAATSATNAATSETNAAASANSQIRFAFATSTTMADPGGGNFRMNNATPSSVTAIAFDATMNQTGNPDISDYLATWDDSTNTITGQLTLIKKGEPETFVLFNVTAVTDNTGWLQITVAHVASNGTFSASDNVDTFFARAGDSGILSNLVEDLTPQLGGNLDVNGKSIVSASNGDIPITPNGTGDVILDGLKWPQADGSANQVIKTDGAGQLAFASGILTENFESGVQTITSGGLLTLAHSLSSAPRPSDVQIILKNTSAEFNYSIGDEINPTHVQRTNTGAQARGVVIRTDATNILIRMGNSANVFDILNKTTGAGQGITNSSWDLIVRAQV